MTDTYDCVIIGAGITGLSAAFYAKQKFSNLAIVDGSAYGGVIRTVKKDGFNLECGPNVFSLKPELVALIKELGIEEQICFPSIKTYKQMVFFKDKAVIVPKGAVAFLFSSLFSISDKIKIAKNIFTSNLFTNGKDLSVAEFFSRILGVDAVKNVLDPVLLGIFGGDVHSLSAKSLFPKIYSGVVSGKSFFKSISGAKRPGIAVIKGGMETLISALSREIEGKVVNYKSNVDSLTKTKESFSIKLNDGKLLSSKNVFICTSGKNTGKFIVDLNPQLSEVLSLQKAAPLVVVHVSVEKLQPEFRDSFGVLFPSSLNTPLLGVMFNSRLFPHLAPVGKELLTICFGGMHHTNINEIEDDKLIELAKNELALRLKIIATEVINITRWDKAIPQYNIGHENLHRLMKSTEANFPGLHFLGADCGGIGVPDRVQQAKTILVDIPNSR